MVKGAIPFFGSTTYGELRSLCGLWGSFQKLANDNTASCLPSQLTSMGWETMGLHGFSGSMFARKVWWPRIGLNRMLFKEELLMGGGQCGSAFRGVCDDHLIETAFELARAPKRFVSALALNSHLPLMARPLPDSLQTHCQPASGSRQDCVLSVVLGEVMSAVHDNLLGMTPGTLPLVRIAGDHPPPFTGDTRTRYSDTRVPFHALIPRSWSCPSRPRRPRRSDSVIRIPGRRDLDTPSPWAPPEPRGRPIP